MLEVAIQKLGEFRSTGRLATLAEAMQALGSISSQLGQTEPRRFLIQVTRHTTLETVVPAKDADGAIQLAQQRLRDAGVAVFDVVEDDCSDWTAIPLETDSLSAPGGTSPHLQQLNETDASFLIELLLELRDNTLSANPFQQASALINKLNASTKQ